jgi:type I restriction enzyme, R subunit
MKFNEDSRVKIPTILHLEKLGYKYLSLKDEKWDAKTNIFIDIFFQKIKQINPDFSESEIKNFYKEISLTLENEDLGKKFYENLTKKTGIKLIDFENFNNNCFNTVTELTYKKDEDEFRPDITILINGIPLAFIEVKKPNNQDGILAEFKRIKTRFKNKKFISFINITQLIIFSNNMEYDDSTIRPIEGAFYATTSYQEPLFNYFREEEKFNLKDILLNISDEEETKILQDTNLIGIKHSPEFLTNKDPNSPTNRICTSLLQRKRLSFLLQYGLAYLNDKDGIKKHIMRYPQLFATKAMKHKLLDKNIKKGVIWHTQGSGKTALAYFSQKYLLDNFQSKGIVSKFYFIVDRIDLLKQATREFSSRGLAVHKISSKEEFSKDIKSTTAIHNDSGKNEITVVNIQKFENNPNLIKTNDYNLNIQRVYFLDEVHRSYNPKGSFLANLHESDINAIQIGLTGTPLLGKETNTRLLFGDYIHKYFYNSSIADGYTLRLIREEIGTQYKLNLQKTLEEIKVIEGDVDRSELYAHKKFVEPMLDYIVDDFKRSRISTNDNSIGAMVICDSYEQAEKMYNVFISKYAGNKKNNNEVNSAKLILYDVGTKDERDQFVEDFKVGKIDILFVFNMLLTGFDSPRLKKIYIGRKIKSHNLLQALTRVNRPYKDFRYGYVVDFADIQQEFDKTNRAYFDELKLELGDEIKNYENMFKSINEIDKEVEDIKNFLFRFNTENIELFSQQISKINNRKEISEITKALNNARELYNIIRLSGHYKILEKIDFKKISKMYRVASDRLALINAKEILENKIDSSSLLNIALEDVIFAFTKINEAELILADKLKDILQKTREGLGGNFDPRDPKFISLKEELKRLFEKKNLNEVSREEMDHNINELNKIHKMAKELERNNQLLKAKYDNDEKYTRLHKRLMEKNPLTDNESKLFEVLNCLKLEADTQILQNSKILENENYVKKMFSNIIINQFKVIHKLPIDVEKTNLINNLIVKEYINEYQGNEIS